MYTINQPKEKSMRLMRIENGKPCLEMKFINHEDMIRYIAVEGIGSTADDSVSGTAWFDCWFFNPIFQDKAKKREYSYHLLDENDCVVDMNNYYAEVRKYYFDNFYHDWCKKYSVKAEYRERNKKKKKDKQHRKKHTVWGNGKCWWEHTGCYKYRKHPIHYYDDEGELIYTAKPKHQYPACYSSGKSSTGWKEKKHKHQWEHNLTNGNKKRGLTNPF